MEERGNVSSISKRIALVLAVVLVVCLIVSAWSFSLSAHAAQVAPVAPMRTLPYYVLEQLAQSF
jgi:hypothetical protein